MSTTAGPTSRTTPATKLLDTAPLGRRGAVRLLLLLLLLLLLGRTTLESVLLLSEAR